jgi:hypothetical protein
VHPRIDEMNSKLEQKKKAVAEHWRAEGSIGWIRV